MVEHPAAKKTPFQAECVTTENQPFPLIHVRKLKKSDGSTKSKLPNARLLIDRVSVLSKCIATHTAPDAVLAVNDIGALSYFGDRRIVDLMGLATPAILPHRREGPAGIARFVETACPDYLVIFPAWFPELAARGDRFRPVERVRLAHNVVAGAAEMVVYETIWRRDRADRVPCGRVAVAGVPS